RRSSRGGRRAPDRGLDGHPLARPIDVRPPFAGVVFRRHAAFARPGDRDSPFRTVGRSDFDGRARALQALHADHDRAAAARPFSHRLGGVRSRAVMNAPASVLVVDKLRIRQFLCAALTANGYRPSEARTVAEAVSIARDENPDLVLLDLDLPDGDGTD